MAHPNAGRKSPVVLAKWKRTTDARQAIWDEIRGVTGFTLAELSNATKIHPATVRSYLAALTAGGIVTRTEDGVYAVVHDVGLHAPRLRPDGTRVEMGAGRGAAWRAMRVLKRFTVRELHNASGAAESDIKSFVGYLAKAGYLRVIDKGHPGKGATYAIARDSGPRAPQVTRLKIVWDPNLERVTWPTETVEPEAVAEGAP
jgi:hypothetical protein